MRTILHWMMRWVAVILHCLDNWLGLRKSGEDYFLTIQGSHYLLKHVPIPSDNILDEYFEKHKDHVVLSHEKSKFAYPTQYLRSLENSFLIIFNDRGGYCFLCHSYEKGYEEIGRNEGIRNKDFKVLAKQSFKNKFYILEKIN